MSAFSNPLAEVAVCVEARQLLMDARRRAEADAAIRADKARLEEEWARAALAPTNYDRTAIPHKRNST